MNQVSPSDLAQLLPVQDNEVIFQYEATHDGSFQYPQVDGAAKVNLDHLPQQVYKAVYKPAKNEQWNVGCNIFQQGVDIKYQPFFWLGDPPPADGALRSEGKFKQAGPIMTLDLNSRVVPVAAQVNIPSYPWLTCTVQPLFCKFAMSVLSGVVQPNPPLLTTEIVRTTHYINKFNHPVTYKPAATYEYNQAVQTTVTDTHSFEAGITLTYSAEVGWFFDKATFTVAVSLKYGFTHSTTSTKQVTKKYTFGEPEEFILQPHEEAYLSLILSADKDASATVSLDIQLSGSINGTVLSGSFLEQIANAMSSTTVKQVNEQSVVYTVTGIITGDVVSDGQMQISSTPPENFHGVIEEGGDGQVALHSMVVEGAGT